MHCVMAAEIMTLPVPRIAYADSIALFLDRSDHSYRSLEKPVRIRPKHMDQNLMGSVIVRHPPLDGKECPAEISPEMHQELSGEGHTEDGGH